MSEYKPLKGRELESVKIKLYSVTLEEESRS